MSDTEHTFEDSRTEDLIEVGFHYHAPTGPPAEKKPSQ